MITVTDHGARGAGELAVGEGGDSHTMVKKSSARITKPSVAVFHSGAEAYYADTCDPLHIAAERGEVRLEARVHGSYPGSPLPPRSLIDVRTVGYWDAEHNQSWGLDWHRNEGIELTYLARGKLDFSVDDQRYHLKRGDLTITRPWQRHRVGDPTVNASRLYWLILDVGVRRPNQTWQWPAWLVSSDSDIACLTAMLSHNEHPVWDANDEIAYYFEKLGDVIDAYEEESGESRLKLYTSGLVVAVTELLRRQRPALDTSLSSTQRTVELFLTSLSDHLDQEWDLDAMAEQCGLGRTRFAHYCKEVTNMSPNDYLTCCRVQRATRLLMNQGGGSILEIASRCGFGSSQYFATVFRQHIGCSPQAYREREAAARCQTEWIGSD